MPTSLHGKQEMFCVVVDGAPLPYSPEQLSHVAIEKVHAGHVQVLETGQFGELRNELGGFLPFCGRRCNHRPEEVLVH